MKGNNTIQSADCNDNFKPIPGETRNYFTPTKNGNYAVLITKDSCSAYSACYNYQIVSTEEMPQSSIEIFPNPVNDRLNIDFDTAFEGAGHVKVFDISGKLVKSESHISTPACLIDFSNLPPGVYLVKAQSGSSRISLKVIKQ